MGQGERRGRAAGQEAAEQPAGEQPARHRQPGQGRHPRGAQVLRSLAGAGPHLLRGGLEPVSARPARQEGRGRPQALHHAAGKGSEERARHAHAGAGHPGHRRRSQAGAGMADQGTRRRQELGGHLDGAGPLPPGQQRAQGSHPDPAGSGQRGTRPAGTARCAGHRLPEGGRRGAGDQDLRAHPAGAPRLGPPATAHGRVPHEPQGVRSRAGLLPQIGRALAQGGRTQGRHRQRAGLAGQDRRGPRHCYRPAEGSAAQRRRCGARR